MARRDHERRQTIARARGFPVPYIDARGVFRNPSNAYYQYAQTVAGERAPRPARVRLGDGEEIVNTRREDVLRAAIERAADNDMRLNAWVTIASDPEDGSHPRSWPRRVVQIWQHGGYRAGIPDRNGTAGARAELAKYGGIAFGFIKAQLDAIDKYPGPVLSVQLNITNP